MHYRLFLYWVIGIINWSNWVEKANFQLLINNRHMHSKILEGLSLGLSFQFFVYLGFEFEYFANLLQISNKII